MAVVSASRATRTGSTHATRTGGTHAMRGARREQRTSNSTEPGRDQKTYPLLYTIAEEVTRESSIGTAALYARKSGNQISVSSGLSGLAALKLIVVTPPQALSFHDRRGSYQLSLNHT